MFTLKKTVAHLMLASALLASGDVLAKYTEVKRLGTNEAVCLGGVKTVKEFQDWTARNEQTVRAILSQTALKGEKEQAQIFNAIAKGLFVEKEYPTGTTFHWMSSKKKGVPTLLPDRIWAGEKSFVGYEMVVVSDSKKYTVVVPKICCNFSLVSIEEIAPPPAPAPTPAPAAPVIKKESGIVPFVAVIGGSESLKRFEPRWNMDMQDSSGIVGLRIGAKIRLAEGLNLVPAVGLVHRTSLNEGSDYPESTGHIDLGIEKNITGNIFVGAGLGLWNANKSSFDEPSAYVNVGGGIAKGLDWFVEGRTIDADDSGTFYGAGIRMNF